MKENLRDLSLELEYELAAIGSTISSLLDVKVLFGQLTDSMDTAVNKGEELLYYHEHHRMVRVLSEYVYYLVTDISTHYEKADKTKVKIVDMSVKNKRVHENKECRMIAGTIEAAQ